MPAVDLTTLPTIPYVYSGTTPATPDTVQLISVPIIPGVQIILHNRDKASKTLRVSFDPALVQDGAAPAMYFTIEDPLMLKSNSAHHSGFQPASVLALFSGHASTNYEIAFVPI